jgi:hypothetical protein
MQDSNQDNLSESKPPTRHPYKLVFGFTNSLEDFNTIQSDPVHREVIRVVSELVTRLRADYPDRGVICDVTECVVSDEGYIL